MHATTELRFAPAVTAMTAFIEPHRPWLESVLGCPMTRVITFEVELPFGQFAAETLLAGVPLDRACLAGTSTLRPLVSRWALPPGVSPRIALEPSRNREAPLLCQDLAWDPHWKETPVAVWLQGLTHALVAIDIPFVSYASGLRTEWQHWLAGSRRGPARCRRSGCRRRAAVLSVRVVPSTRLRRGSHRTSRCRPAGSTRVRCGLERAPVPAERARPRRAPRAD